jgi:hypothetical protein
MSGNLVIHIGAGKCASSSVQDSLRALQREKPHLFDYFDLNPWALTKLLAKDDAQIARDYIDLILSKADNSRDLVISHEVLSKLPTAVGEIVDRAMALQRFKKIIIIGYTRGHSGYFQSYFRQWHFRDPNMLASDIALFDKLALDPKCFTSLERHLFSKAWILTAATTEPRDSSWHDYYVELHDIMAAAVKSNSYSIYSNHIPSQSRPYSIFLDFLKAAELDVEASTAVSYERRSNDSFYPVMTEAISAILCDRSPESASIPGPHHGNNWLFQLGQAMKSTQLHGTQSDTSQLVRYCSNVIDNIYYNSNMRYCDLMNVEKSAFSTFNDTSCSKDLLLDAAKQLLLERDHSEFNQQLDQSIASLKQAMNTVGLSP